MSKTVFSRFVIVAFVVVALGCGGSKQPTVATGAFENQAQITKIVDQIVSEPDRRRQVKNALIRVGYATNDYYQQLWKIRTQGFYLNATYSRNREDYDRLISELAQLRDRKFNQIINAAMEARGILTEEEWQKYAELMGAYYDEQEAKREKH